MTDLFVAAHKRGLQGVSGRVIDTVERGLYVETRWGGVGLRTWDVLNALTLYLSPRRRDLFVDDQGVYCTDGFHRFVIGDSIKLDGEVVDVIAYDAVQLVLDVGGRLEHIDWTTIQPVDDGFGYDQLKEFERV